MHNKTFAESSLLAIIPLQGLKRGGMHTCVVDAKSFCQSGIQDGYLGFMSCELMRYALSTMTMKNVLMTTVPLDMYDNQQRPIMPLLLGGFFYF